MFTADYLLFCSENQAYYAKKRPLIGDWYLDEEARTLKVLAGPDDIASLSPSAFFVPDLDDLFELMDAQLRFIGSEPGECKITVLKEDGKWSLEIRHPDGIITNFGRHESLHSTLWWSVPHLATVADLRWPDEPSAPPEIVNSEGLETEPTKEQISKKIDDMLESKGLQIVRFAQQRYAEMGRGYVTICIKDSEDTPWKEGLFYYTTEEENKLFEQELPHLTENDTKLALNLKDYDPETDAVIMVWHGTDYCVKHISDRNAINSIMALNK
jgi:hypothetical protein